MVHCIAHKQTTFYLTDDRAIVVQRSKHYTIALNGNGSLILYTDKYRRNQVS